MLVIIFCHIFIRNYGMGLRGAGFAMALSNILIFIAMNIYLLFVEETKKAVRWPDKRMFKDIRQYLELGIPASLSLCFDWWAYEIMILFCGLIGVNEQAGQIIIQNFYTLLFCIPLGL